MMGSAAFVVRVSIAFIHCYFSRRMAEALGNEMLVMAR